MRRFEPYEDKYLKDNYLQKTLSELGSYLNRNQGSIHGRLNFLGLKIPFEIREQRKRIPPKIRKGVFQKGLTPWNKGKKMNPETYEKVANTMFKPNSIPVNCIHFGKPYQVKRIRKDGYQEYNWFIQVDKKRRPYLAYLCEQNGIDMKGKKPRLKSGIDKSKEPCFKDIEIVSNSENMRLNSMQRFPEEVRKLIQIKGVLNRQIKKLK